MTDNKHPNLNQIHTLPWSQKQDIDALLEQIGDKQVVMLGEASHGTHEYYAWRAEISKRLITEKGFSFVAVEGDWPDCFKINRYVKHYDTQYSTAHDVLMTFRRWPTWMWSNEEVASFINWLYGYNQDKSVDERIGFYGLDVYSLWDSMEAVVQYLQKVDPQSATRVKQAYRCFDPYGGDGAAYAYDTPFTPGKCEDDVINVLKLLTQQLPHYPNDHEADFDAEQNARVARNAEQYYRTMVRGSAASWNVRDRHMSETLAALMQRYGKKSGKAIIWAHNTHIGDARATDMAESNMFNIGQLARQEYSPENVALVGFGSYKGEVIAGRYWDAPMQIMPVPSARPGSFEWLLHDMGGNDLLILNTAQLPQRLHQSYSHRAIGVVYNPAHDKTGNYVPSIIPRRYDAFIYIDTTTALHPLTSRAVGSSAVDETYPFGV